MRHSRVLISTGYGLALLLLVLPLLQSVIALVPLQPRQVSWRLQVFGALSQALLLPVLGHALALGTAVLLGHRWMVALLSITAFLGATVLAVASGLFLLDLVQYRTLVGTALRDYYELAGVIYLSGYILAGACLGWIGFASWRVLGRGRKRLRQRSSAAVTKEEG
jgi:hypothetical protein